MLPDRNEIIIGASAAQRSPVTPGSPRTWGTFRALRHRHYRTCGSACWPRRSAPGCRSSPRVCWCADYRRLSSVALDASPDLRFQIEATPKCGPPVVLYTRPFSLLLSPLRRLTLWRVFFPCASFQPLDIYATRSVLRILREDNSLFALLDRVPRQAVWKEIQRILNFA